MIKRWTSLFAALLLVFGLNACQAKDGSVSVAPVSSREEAFSPQPPESVASAAQPAGEPEPEAEPESEPPAVGTDPLTGLEANEGMQEGQRPVAVMVRNNVRALPQRGIRHAQVVVEMMVEDGTTNLMAVFSDLREIRDVGPVCAIQDQFAQMALPLSAIPAYINASQYARNLFAVTDNYQVVDGFYVGRTGFWYDYERTLPKPGGYLHEYSWFTNADTLRACMEQLGIAAAGQTAALFRFDSSRPAPGEAAVNIRAFYSGQAYTDFAYIPEYEEYADGVLDSPRLEEEDTRITYRNVFLLQAGVGKKADSNLLEYDFSGGEGYYFTKGGVAPIKWQKGGPTGKLELFDENNSPLSVNTGKSYIGFLPVGEGYASEVTWNGGQESPDADSEA